MRQYFSDVSDRTFARYRRAMKLIKWTGADLKTIIDSVARPNGSMSYSKLLEHAESVAAMKVLKTEGKQRCSGKG
jgi:hypothetical protein